MKTKRTILVIVIIIAVIVCVIFLIGLGSILSNQSSSVEVQSTRPVSQPITEETSTTSMSWHTIIAINNSNKFLNTPAFSMQGTEWRITWSCSLINKPLGEGGFAASIASVINNSGHNFAIGDDCTSGTTTPTYYYGEKPGQYYLRLGPTNSTYSVTVEDYY